MTFLKTMEHHRMVHITIPETQVEPVNHNLQSVVQKIKPVAIVNVLFLVVDAVGNIDNKEFLTSSNLTN